jgi:hypothetical protein
MPGIAAHTDQSLSNVWRMDVFAGVEHVSTLFTVLMSYLEERICVDLVALVLAVIELPHPSKSTSRSGFLMMAFESQKVELARLVATEESRNLNVVLQQFGNTLAFLYMLQQAVVRLLCVCVCARSQLRARFMLLACRLKARCPVLCVCVCV